MATQTVILDSDLIHFLCLDLEELKAVGLRQDLPLAVSLQDGRIVLQPADPVDALCGVLAGGASMTDELIEERRREDERSRQKYGW